jgi:ferredoxin-NADP reductase
MQLTLVERKTEVPGVESFIFKAHEGITWKAGQYLHYVLHHLPTDDRGSDRWFTIASAPYEGRPMITTRLSAEKPSSFKTMLSRMNVGDAIEATDVDGNFTLDDEGGSYVFLAGGIGITPFHSMLKELDHEGKKLDITLLYANRDEQVPYKDELELFRKNNPHLTIEYITAPKQIDQECIQKFVPDIKKPYVCVAGPEPMVKKYNEMLLDMGVDETHIKLDDFPGYPAD